MAIFLKAKKVVFDEGLYSAGRDKRAANSEVVEIPTPSTEVVIVPPDPNSALVATSEVDEIPTPRPEVVIFAPNEDISFVKFDDEIERPNKIAQQIVNLEEQVRLLKEKPGSTQATSQTTTIYDRNPAQNQCLLW